MTVDNKPSAIAKGIWVTAKIPKNVTKVAPMLAPGNANANSTACKNYVAPTPAPTPKPECPKVGPGHETKGTCSICGRYYDGVWVEVPEEGWQGNYDDVERPF